MDKNKRLTPICIIYVDGERLGPAWEGRFRSIRVVDRLSGISGCAIVFSGDNSGKMDTEIFSVGSTISVYMGFKDDIRETFNGEVATFASTLPEAGGSSKLVVTAASYLGQLDRNGQSRVFENVSPSRIIQKILSEYGLQADCESFGPVKERLKEEGMSDWKFILELARRYGRNIYCFGKNVYVKAHMTMHKDEHIYEWGKSLIGLDVTMGDIGKATGVQVISHDQITGEDFVGECKLEDVKLKIGGRNDWRSVYAGVARDSIQTVVGPNVQDRTEAEEVAEAILREKSFDFIKGYGEAEGDAGLRAGAVVTIKYAGIRYDGEYIAEEVVHELSMREGYTTEFDIRRNMIGDEAVKELGGSRAVGPSRTAIIEKEIVSMPFIAKRAPRAMFGEEEEPIRPRPFRSLTDEEVEDIIGDPRFFYEWDLPHRYAARRGSTLSFQSVRNRTPRVTANILGTNRELAYWIFVQEPGLGGKVIGVPVLFNTADNGGLDTGRWANVRTALGGEATGRFSSFTLSATGDAVMVRTVLRNTIQAVFEDLASEVPDFVVRFYGSVEDRIGRTRSKNHPNGVAIDINHEYNETILRTDPERHQPGINATRPHLISAAVESIVNRHGWRTGYFWSGRQDGVFHWSVSGT